MTSKGHHWKRLTTIEERLWSQIEVAPNGCWIWTRAVSRDGYGQIWWKGRLELVHRIVYELLIGPIPVGLTIDHVKKRGCISRACCNPQHLEAVTMGVNVLRGDGPAAINARKTRCNKNHPLKGKNLYIEPQTGKRVCRICKRATNTRARQRRRQSQKAG